MCNVSIFNNTSTYSWAPSFWVAHMPNNWLANPFTFSTIFTFELFGFIPEERKKKVSLQQLILIFPSIIYLQTNLNYEEEIQI